MPKQNDETDFQRLLRYMPADMVQEYKLGVLLKQYEEAQEQLVAELGDAGAADAEAKICRELVPKMMELGLKIAAEHKEAQS